jgi:hypothetical protein
MQLLRGERKAAQTGRRFECLDAVEKRQSAHLDHQEN